MDYEFEFDPDKSEANKVKHGIDFVEAQALWHSAKIVTVATSFEAEERWMGVALYRDRYWTAIYTLRDGVIRLISVRRSRDYEIERYKENIS